MNTIVFNNRREREDLAISLRNLIKIRINDLEADLRNPGLPFRRERSIKRSIDKNLELIGMPKKYKV